MDVDALKGRLRGAPTTRALGRVLGVTGLSVRVALPGARIGDLVEIRRRGEPLLAEIVGVSGGEAIVLPLGETTGLGADDAVDSTSAPLEIRVGDALLGRVLDGLGRPLDGKPPAAGETVAVNHPPTPALERQRVEAPLSTGIRALDGLLTLGEGQRVGLFSASGVGKSSLLASISRGAAADVVVVALVGERGREVREFVEGALSPVRERTVAVVATSDAPAVERVRAAQVATRIGEWFRDEGRRVLLLVDSITRVARAQREVGLSGGEPPARRGFPPSVFALLPRLLERAGQGRRGSITALYTVLVEGDDLDEPVTDEVRGILDGHVVLSRKLAALGHYPAIDVTASVSRVMPVVTTAEHQKAASAVRRLLATHEEKRDLVALGAYKEGAEPGLDRALAAMPSIDGFLRQAAEERSAFADTVDALSKMARRFGG